jgi:putative hemolysin
MRTDSASIGNRVLARGASQHNYQARLAVTAEDVKAAQTLRFLVFNLELNEGLEQSFSTCRDADPFDEVCDHLLVEETTTREVVGTYRLQPGSTALAAKGYYSAQEFDLDPLLDRAGEIIELGRACVHIQHRNLAVLGLLWKGIHTYARERSGRYLLGCSSLSSTDPKVGAAVYSQLVRRHLAGPDWRVTPLPALACPLLELAAEHQKVPKLLSAYLSLGAKICGAPAIDREFKTIDFLTFLDLDTLCGSLARFLS